MDISLTLPEVKKIKVVVKDENSNFISGAVADGAGVVPRLPYSSGGLALEAISRIGQSDPTNSSGETHIYTFSFGFVVTVRYTSQAGTPFTYNLPLYGIASPPTEITLSENGKNTAKLSWRPPAVTWSEDISDFQVQVARDCIDYREISHNPSSATSFNLSGLRPGTKYCFKVAAITKNGLGEFSPVFEFTTSPSSPDSPSRMFVKNLSSNSLSLAWSEPWSGGQRIDDYKIEVSSNCSSYATISKSPSASLGFKVTGLKPGTKYCFRVSAGNSIGYSLPATAIQVVTSGYSPAAPTSLSVKAAKTSVILGWKAAIVNGGSAVRNYIVEYSKNKGYTWSKVAKPVSTSRSLTVKGLRSKTIYLFRVTAVNDVGNSKASKTLKVTTG
jgi:hypothetical protein